MWPVIFQMFILLFKSVITRTAPSLMNYQSKFRTSINYIISHKSYITWLTALISNDPINKQGIIKFQLQTTCCGKKNKTCLVTHLRFTTSSLPWSVKYHFQLNLCSSYFDLILLEYRTVTSKQGLNDFLRQLCVFF